MERAHAATDVHRRQLFVVLCCATGQAVHSRTVGLAVRDPLDPDEEVTFTLTCTYTNLDDGAEVRADLNASYDTNSLPRVISGSPAAIIFTVQSD